MYTLFEYFYKNEGSTSLSDQLFSKYKTLMLSAVFFQSNGNLYFTKKFLKRGSNTWSTYCFLTDLKDPNDVNIINVSFIWV